MNTTKKHNTRGIKVNIATSLKRTTRSLVVNERCESMALPSGNLENLEVFQKVTATLSTALKVIFEKSEGIMQKIEGVCQIIQEGENICLQGKWNAVENARQELQKHINVNAKDKNNHQESGDKLLDANPKSASAHEAKAENQESDCSGSKRRKRGRPRKTPLTNTDSSLNESQEQSNLQSELTRSEHTQEQDADPSQDRDACHSVNVNSSESHVDPKSQEKDTSLPLPKSAKKCNVHQCDNCKETFKSMQQLRRHSKIHKNLKHKMESVKTQEILEGDSGDILLKENIALMDNISMLGAKTYLCKKCGVKLKTKSMALQHLEEMHTEVLKIDQRGCQQSTNKNSENGETAESRNESTALQNASESADKSSRMDSISEENDRSDMQQNFSESEVTDTFTPVEQEKDEENGLGTIAKHEKESDEMAEKESLENNEGLTAQAESAEELGGLQEPSNGSLEDVGRKVRLPTRSLMITEPKKATEVCKHCGFKSSVAGMRTHIRRYHNSVLYFCDVCDKSFGIAGELNAHRKHHFDSEGNKKPLNWRVGYRYKKPDQPAPYPCKQCDKTFYRNVDLKHHMSVHQNGDNPEGTTYQCGMCKFQSVSLPKVKRHIDRYHSKKSDASGPHKCEDCVRMFTTELRLRQHREKAHEREFICDQCGKKFSCHRYLFMHKRRHSEVKKFVCDICGRGFHENNKLLLHKETHLSEGERMKRFVCEVCQKGFSSNNYLKDHMNIHKGINPYQCGTCGRLFSTQVACRRHAVDHNKEPKYKCPVSECGKMFTASFRLKYHMTVHTKQSKYTCEFCHKAYTQLSTLKRHVCKASGAREITTTLKSASEATGVMLTMPVMHESGQIVIENVEHIEKTMYCCSVCQMIFENWDEIQTHVSEHAETNSSLVTDTLVMNDAANESNSPIVQAVPHIQTLTTTIQDNLMEIIPENVIMETIVLTDNCNQNEVQVTSILNETNESENTVLNESEAQVPVVLNESETPANPGFDDSHAPGLDDCQTKESGLNETEIVVPGILTDSETHVAAVRGILDNETGQYYSVSTEKSAETMTVNEETIVTMETKIIDRD